MSLGNTKEHLSTFSTVKFLVMKNMEKYIRMLKNDYVKIKKLKMLLNYHNFQYLKQNTKSEVSKSVMSIFSYKKYPSKYALKITENIKRLTVFS